MAEALVTMVLANFIFRFASNPRENSTLIKEKNKVRMLLLLSVDLPLNDQIWLYEEVGGFALYWKCYIF